MTNTRTDFKPGDVVRYEPLERPSRHCREGMAIAEARLDGVVLFDTYWRTSGDRHLLTYDELGTSEVVFNLDDYDELDQSRHGAADTWRKYSPDDRQVITSQHGLVRRFFIREGAQPGLTTQIENAREAVVEAERKLSSAQFSLDCARRDLARLEGTDA